MEIRIGGLAQYFRYHLFVSYRSVDADPATLLTHALQRAALRVWLDRDPGAHDQAPRSDGDLRGAKIPGDDAAVEAALREAIRYSLILVAVTSPETLASTWVRRELGMARDWEHPCFFWHVVTPGEKARHVSVKTADGKYDRQPLAPLASSALLRELAAHGDLNVIGHRVSTPTDVDEVAGELRQLIELVELIVHNRDQVTVETVQKHWPEFAELNRRATELEETIRQRYGRNISPGRVPASEMFRLKNPFVKKRVRHLERLLEDEAFRNQEFSPGNDQEK